MKTTRPGEKTSKPFEQASTLPGEVYRSREMLATELDRIYGGMWLAVGREEDLPAPGSCITREIGTESVLLLRDDDGVARAFHNVCRHRGTRLVPTPEAEKLERIQCPYHAWTYRLDGKLAAAPLMESTPGFAKEDYPLVSVNLETWEGFFFVNLDEDAPSLKSQLDGLPDLTRFHLSSLRRGNKIAYDVAANWKIIGENYNECYHCAHVHPQLQRVTHYLGGGRSRSGPNFTGGPMTLNQDCTTMTMSGTSRRPPFPDLDPEDYRNVRYFHLFPNLLLSLLPDYVITHTVWPRDTNHSQVVCEWFFSSEAIAGEDFDARDAVEFWDLTNRQDWVLCENVQKGVQSKAYRPGRYQAVERCVYDFDRWYLEYMERSAGR
ncbi:MAG: aromatic ring-hydroxylating oxygenase subunit alpha [Vicinamibacteria bacterium]